MKRILYLGLSLMLIVGSIFSITLAQEGVPVDPKENQGKGDWTTKQDPIGVLDSVKRNANKNRSNEVQNTKLDYIMSECTGDPLAWNGVGFTITKTICNIKSNMKEYLQYVIFAGLTAATIFLIRNGFQLVISSDKGKQIGVFKKNIVYIIVGIILITGFYYILDIIVTLVNFISE